MWNADEIDALLQKHDLASKVEDPDKDKDEQMTLS